MKKFTRLFVITLALIIVFTFAACAKSAFDFDKDAAIKRAKEVIDVVNTKDYTAIYNLFSDNAKKLTTVDGIQAAFQPFIDPAGSFVEYKSADAIGLITKDGTKYINVYVKTVYEKKSYVYTVSFDTDLNLEGFHTS